MAPFRALLGNLLLGTPKAPSLEKETDYSLFLPDGLLHVSRPGQLPVSSIVDGGTDWMATCAESVKTGVFKSCRACSTWSLGGSCVRLMT